MRVRWLQSVLRGPWERFREKGDIRCAPNCVDMALLRERAIMGVRSGRSEDSILREMASLVRGVTSCVLEKEPGRVPLLVIGTADAEARYEYRVTLPQLARV